MSESDCVCYVCDLHEGDEALLRAKVAQLRAKVSELTAERDKWRVLNVDEVRTTADMVAGARVAAEREKTAALRALLEECRIVFERIEEHSRFFGISSYVIEPLERIRKELGK